MPTLECPICQKIIVTKSRDDAPYRPFCSCRCKQVDLGRWLDGTYAISEQTHAGDGEELTDVGEE